MRGRMGWVAGWVGGRETERDRERELESMQTLMARGWQLQPDWSEAFNALGNVLVQQQKLRDAEAAYVCNENATNMQHSMLQPHQPTALS